MKYLLADASSRETSPFPKNSPTSFARQTLAATPPLCDKVNSAVLTSAMNPTVLASLVTPPLTTISPVFACPHDASPCHEPQVVA
ncbi:hypothetical protein Cni_G01719 [Canna indica]|uniref:Uncharacterized protein n=1 Tax=Canna indica TaxID=4628 RepID=A0AAQ3JQR9_9LILI|nr:hypothetical protein Cni_G01719 [Canna indica]